MKIRTVITFAAVAAALPIAVRAAEASENWTKLCARCHGPDGAGKTKVGAKLKLKDYTTAEAQDAMKDEDMLKAILEGVKDDAGKDRMPSYTEKLTEDDAKALVAYVRSFKK